jgi:hypothetical protein
MSITFSMIGMIVMRELDLVPDTVRRTAEVVCRKVLKSTAGMVERVENIG